MSKQDTSGPAFPLTNSHIELRGTDWEVANGLSVRDYFAITLRKLAEAATQGQWISENVRGSGIEMRVPYEDSTRLTFVEVFRALPEEWDKELWANAQYIAAANPTAIIALLDEIDSLRAALAQQAEQGWVRVPVDPTQEMINAYASVPYDEDSVSSECKSGWRAMLAAAPKGGV